MNNESHKIHESIIRDVYDVINDVKDFDQIDWLKTKNNNGSIARRAANLTLVFPVLVSSSLSIQTAMLINKALEKKCAVMIQLLFNSMQMTNAENVFDYIKKFHTNLNLKSSMDLGDFIDTIDLLANEGTIQITDRDAYNAIMEDMKNINFTINNSYNESSVNDFKISRDIYGNQIIMQEAKPASGNINGMASRDRDFINKSLGDTAQDIKDFNSLTYSSLRDNIRGSREDIINAINKIGSKASKSSTYGDEKDLASAIKSSSDAFKNQLSQSEINKANELVPTTMFINFITKTDTGTVLQTGVVGIKCKMFPVDSMDIIDRISSKHADSNWLLKFIKATTREISFIKDFLFAVDRTKLDAINMAKENNSARMFRTLQRRASKNILYTLLKRNDASPITSMVISQEEVEYLKKYNNLDMEKVANCKVILNKYNLMDIVIADETLETAKFLFDDGDSVFEVMAFDSLEKEAKDSSYKKVVNLMSKLNR